MPTWSGYIRGKYSYYFEVEADDEDSARDYAWDQFYIGDADTFDDEIEELTCSEKACEHGLWHGPGHQTRTKCRLVGDHDVHEVCYGPNWLLAQWRGDNDVMTGFMDEPPVFDGNENDVSIEEAF